MPKCTPCRVRHLTCDQSLSCSECEKAGRECLRGYNIRFRYLACEKRSKAVTRSDYSKYEFFFDDDQAWVDVSEKLEFVQESDDYSNTLPAEEQVNMEEADLITKPRRMSTSAFPTPSAAAFSLDEKAPGHPDEARRSGQIISDEMDLLETGVLTGGSLSGETLHPESRISVPQTPISTSDLAWPLKNLQQGKLLQHFVTYLAPWFDAGNNSNLFGKDVPRMATSSPLLMTAILALSALHHSRVTGESDPYAAIRYYDRCVSMMVPMLNEPDHLNNDCLLVTTVILHLYEDLDEGNDSPRHLKGTTIFFPAEATAKSSQLRRAVFWIHLEMETYNAYSHQRSVRTDFSTRDIESYTEDTGDDMWFHKALCIAAFVSKWAFDEDANSARWRELCKDVDDWEQQRPSSFDPVYFLRQDPHEGRYFPEVCYLADGHVDAVHFFYLAKLLLTTHDPRIPRIGPRMKAATAAMQETALSHVRMLVGIAICNNYVPARFTASLAIIICGSWFTDRGEQNALLEFMRTTDKCSGWPRRKAQLALIEEWGREGELI